MVPMDKNTPECSHDTNPSLNENPQLLCKMEEQPETIVTPLNIPSPASPQTPKSFSLHSVPQHEQRYWTSILGSVPLTIRPSLQNPITCQPRSSLQSPLSRILPNQPHTLFVQALSKLNESSMSIAGLNQLKSLTQRYENQTIYQTGDITPPDSLTSAPPSYSFVLRQMAARRRPRLMGTFIPSPSFVQHTPPPNYTTAFDIYVDNRIPTPPTRIYHFGFASMPAVCPECGYAGMTVVTSRITVCTHVCAFILCLFCCWICAPLPYILRSCKDVYHYCQNCRTFLGMYCPTNPDNNFS